MLAPGSIEKEYEQIVRTPFVFQQAKPALWKTPLGRAFFVLPYLINSKIKKMENLTFSILFVYSKHTAL